MKYSELNLLPADAFLHPENFNTGLESAELSAKQYRAGRDAYNKYTRVTIGAGGCWSAKGINGSFTSSYEGIGYHSGTGDLLKGFLDSGIPVYVVRAGSEGEGLRRFRLHPSGGLFNDGYAEEVGLEEF